MNGSTARHNYKGLWGRGPAIFELKEEEQSACNSVQLDPATYGPFYPVFLQKQEREDRGKSG